MQTNWSYLSWQDGRGLLAGIQSGTSTDPSSLQDFTYSYDLAGNITQIEDWVTANPQVQSFAYDDLNRLTSASASAGNGAYSETYTYDAATGNLASKAGAVYGYTDTEHAHAVTQLDGQTFYTYDANGNMTTRVVGSDTYTLFYDAENRLVEVQKNSTTIAQYFYDADGKMVKKIEGGDTTVYIGNYLEVFIPAGSMPTPTSTQSPMPTSTRTLPPTRTLFFTYTPVNSRTPTITKTATATPVPTNTGLPTNTKTSTPTNTRTYTVTPTRTRTPSKTAGPSSTPTVTRTKTPTATITKTPTITQTRTRTPTNTSYAPTKTYTPTISPTVTSTITRTPTQTYTVTPTSIAPSGQVWKFYYYVGSTRIAERETSQFVNIVYYLFSDHLGSTTVVSNPNGIMQSYTLYKAWGESRYTAGASPTDYGFTGQREEAGIGLYYYNARWYDPALGRFVQADTIVPKTIEILALDRYGYANDNPVKYSDPTGHCFGILAGVDTIVCIFIASLVVGAIADGVNNAISQNKETGQIDAREVTEHVLEGAVIGGGLVLGPYALLAGVDALANEITYYTTQNTDSSLLGTDVINNPVPDRLARVFDADLLDDTELLARPGEQYAFVTAADDLSGINDSQSLSQLLSLADESGNSAEGPFAILEFDTPELGIASPVLQNASGFNSGFIGNGITAGGAREFIIPNIPISTLHNLSIRIIQ